ncbi:uncharacterized protein LOC132903725 [Amyelois transitella]|uniref:uncharacterized protein LOC132903725 n=1 Tax=Amyelois transitella TaxID=680683 RepID=UPI00298FA480|nr:uncharacterized protein LOC132903725 [Amyelois transitella]
MEPGFLKANDSNLPRIDIMMLGDFLANNKEFCSSEFRNVKTSLSSRPSYGDDAISYVQLKREGNICMVKCKICPEHKVHAKLYAVTLMVDENEEKVVSIQCHDCVAAQGGCKHAMALLMWVHRRSEEPSCTEVLCYWRKSKLSRVGTSLKFVSSKDLSKGSPLLPSNSIVLAKFLEEGKKRKVNNCELLKHQLDYFPSTLSFVSMHQLVLKYKEECCELFLRKVNLTIDIINKIENETRDQFKNKLWYELRYGRVTASRAYEVSRCQTDDGTLISIIMGGKIPDTPAMKRGRYLENEVREIVSKKLGNKIKNCGLFIAQKYPMLAGSPDGICQDSIVEIKCPVSNKTYLNYIKNGKPSNKCFAQIQMQMYLSGLRQCYFCVAHPDFSTNKKVEILCITYDNQFMSGFLESFIRFWKSHVYPLLLKSIK